MFILQKSLFENRTYPARTRNNKTIQTQLVFATLANLYPDTPLATDIVGSVKINSKIQVSNLKENFTDFYKPVNMSLFWLEILM